MSLWAWKAPCYSRVRQFPFLKNLLSAEIKQLARLLWRVPRPADLHLDVGSGTGDALAPFKSSRVLICMDASLAMLRQLPGSRKLAARGEFLPFADHAFDFVSAIGVLEYIQDAEVFLLEVRRVLQPEGFFLFTSSPPRVANQLRRMWAERLYLRSEQEIERLLSQTRWHKRDHARTWLQEQWLAVQNGTPTLK